MGKVLTTSQEAKHQQPLLQYQTLHVETGITQIETSVELALNIPATGAGEAWVTVTRRMRAARTLLKSCISVWLRGDGRMGVFSFPVLHLKSFVLPRPDARATKGGWKSLTINFINLEHESRDLEETWVTPPATRVLGLDVGRSCSTRLGWECAVNRTG